MKLRLAHAELLVVAAGLIAAPLCWRFMAQAPLAMPIPSLFKWLGVMLLAQGLLRDLLILAGRRPGCSCATSPAPVMCVESAAGVALIGLWGLLAGLGASGDLLLPPAGWLLLASGWWLVGFTLRNRVVEFRTEPDHLNVVVGRRAS